MWLAEPGAGLVPSLRGMGGRLLWDLEREDRACARERKRNTAPRLPSCALYYQKSVRPLYETREHLKICLAFFSANIFRASSVCAYPEMAPGFDSIRSHAVNTSSKDPASKRKRVNRSAKLKQSKLEARREQWLANQVMEEKQDEKSLHADRDCCINDPGEVLHPEFTATLPIDSGVSWASLLNPSVSSETHKTSHKTHSTARVFRTQAEPDPKLLRANFTYLRIKRPELSPSPSTTECTFYECADTSVSPKSCRDRSPKSKASKMGKGSRRSRGDQCNSKENECIVAEQKENKGQVRKSDGTQAHTQLQDRFYCYNHETEDGWEAAVDALGLLSAPKKSSSGILQVKATSCDDQRQTRTKIAPLLGLKPAKQPGLQHSAQHQKAWMQNDFRRPMSLPSLNKQQGLRVSTCLNDPLDKPQCPICTEDLDSTDTSFNSCPCGFNLCLFCYHKIASENGRCPGCRGVYIRDVSVKPAVLLPR